MLGAVKDGEGVVRSYCYFCVIFGVRDAGEGLVPKRGVLCF